MLPLLLALHSAVASAAELDCAVHPCAEVLPRASTFQAVEGKPFVEGHDDAGELVGWVALSTDVVDQVGYSGKPLVTLVGLDPTGVIVGARVVHHSEPILLVGIPEQKLHDFVATYVGTRADEHVTVGHGSVEGRVVDVVSGATVTVLAENQTLLDTARRLGEDRGVLARTSRVPGHFADAAPMTWAELVKAKALGHLVVTQTDMGLPPGPEPFVDLWFTIADPPQIGIPLLGEATWRYAHDHLAEDEHLVAIFNGGTSSFKGSGFVRGGIFDRVHVEQGLAATTFRDMDYTRVDHPEVADAPPELHEGGLFVARDGSLDPGAAYELVFLGSAYDHAGGYSRDFRSFTAEHRMPRDIYVLDGPDPDDAVWKAAWANGWPKATVVGVLLAILVGLFAARRWTTGRMKRLKVIHTTVMTGAFLGMGLVLHVQPSVTQVLTFIGSASGEWRWSLFLSDPVLFISWIFIAGVTIAWGRGVFCGWACPYGAMNELTFKLGRLLKLPAWELPDRWHDKLRYVRYGVLAMLVAAFLYDSELGERVAEIEPFKSTFFVAPWTRHPALFAWWAVLVGASLVVWRPFCRYLCPLGAALALPSSIRISGPYRRDFCSKCKICTRGCEPRAIRPNGTIDPRECLSCMECEANWRDDEVCPPLVKVRRDLEKARARLADQRAGGAP